MIWELVYYDAVLLDLREAKKWYFEQQKGLEKRFSKDVKGCIERLSKNPFYYEMRYKNVRLVHCETFPYSVHYYIDQLKKQLVIIAILHQHQNPELAKKR